MNRGTISAIIRALGGMHVLDLARYLYARVINGPKNRAFRRENPGVPLPPDYLLFESFKLDYRKYYEGGKETAQWLKATLEDYTDWSGRQILDWGCGPGRVARHLPEILGPECEVHGTDYNEASIAWCRRNLPAVHFHHNSLLPPTDFPDACFDVVFGISIFTHLSEPSHYEWLAELHRILKPAGIALLTTHGDAFRPILTGSEKQAFDRGRLVVRGGVREGHRVFTAFHPPSFMRTFLESRFTIEKHHPGTSQDWGIEQDHWILRKS